MAAPFATAADLAVRLKRNAWADSAELEQVEQHLADASDDLRAEIGWQVYPPVEVTVSAEPDLSGRIRLPGSPSSVTSVTSDAGATVAAGDYTVRDGVLRLNGLGRVSVTYGIGYVDPPPELVRWTCVLAAQSLARAADETLGATPSSEALADYRISYSEQQQLGEIPIPVRVLERLRSTYGQGVHVA